MQGWKFPGELCARRALPGGRSALSQHCQSNPGSTAYTAYELAPTFGAARAALRDEKGEPMKTRTVRLGMGQTSGATRITRKDFLKIGGTGLAGAALLGTAGCGTSSAAAARAAPVAVRAQVRHRQPGDTIRDLDSTTTTDAVSFNVLAQRHRGSLPAGSANSSPIPDMAEKRGDKRRQAHLHLHLARRRSSGPTATP